MSSWPRARLESPFNAGLKSRPADFIVRETLPFFPSGAGEHCLVQLEKTGLTTQELARLLADAHAIDLVDVGYAGMKDRRAVTSQWFSLRGVAHLDETLRELADVKVLAETRHHQKLRRGQIAANSFEVILRNVVEGEGVMLDACLEDLKATGAPNYFGQQRFGWDNVDRAIQWLARRRRSRVSKFKQGLYLSVLRSYLFNEVLGARVAARNWQAPIDGDLLMEGVPTGPLWGRGRSGTHGAAAILEASVLERHQTLQEGLEHAGLKQARRAFVLRSNDFNWRRDGGDLHLAFSLGPGEYATSFLGEVFELTTPGEPGREPALVAPGDAGEK